MSKSKIFINKIFTECRYNNNLFFNDMNKLMTIYRSNNKEFINSDYNRQENTFHLFNPQKRISASVMENRLTFDMDEPISADNFKNKASEYANSVVNILDIDRFMRVGIRSIWGIECGDINEAKDRIHKSFIKLSSEELSKVFGGDVNSTSVVFTSSFGKFKANIALNPNTLGIVEVNNGVTVRNVNRHEINLDIDIYIDEIVDSKEITSIIRSAVELTKERVALISNYMLGE